MEVEIMGIKSSYRQYSTFLVHNNLYGVDVADVQEVVKQLPVTPVPLAHGSVQGLINLRGKVATAICLRTLFQMPQNTTEFMNVVCVVHNTLVALQVDEIGDVLEIEDESIKPLPSNASHALKSFCSGISKQPQFLVSILDLKRLAVELELSE